MPSHFVRRLTPNSPDGPLLCPIHRQMNTISSTSSTMSSKHKARIHIVCDRRLCGAIHTRGVRPLVLLSRHSPSTGSVLSWFPLPLTSLKGMQSSLIQLPSLPMDNILPVESLSLSVISSRTGRKPTHRLVCSKLAVAVSVLVVVFLLLRWRLLFVLFSLPLLLFLWLLSFTV